MSHTEMDRETREIDYCLEQTDLETCPKSVWSPERRERLVSPIGDRLRVTRAREIRKRLTQAERKRKSVTKKAHGERETRASTRTNPVLCKGHPQDVAHPATVDQAESSSETELYSVASLSQTIRFQPLRAGSVTQEREHVLNGKGSDSDGSRCRDRVEPTPTREQTALGRRSPQIGTRSGVPTFSFRQVDESDKVIHFEHDSVDGTGARPKIRENEEYASGNFAAVAPANATEPDTVARSTRQRGSSSFEGIEDWVRALPSTTVQLTNGIPNIQIPGRIGGIDVQSMPRAFEDMRVPGLVHERRMNDPARNVTQSRNPFVQESPQVTRLGVPEIMPRSYEEVGDSINWKKEAILLRESLAMMHKRLEEMSAPVIEPTEFPRGETTRSPCVRVYGEEVQRKPQTEESAQGRVFPVTRKNVSHLASEELPVTRKNVSHLASEEQSRDRGFAAERRTESYCEKQEIPRSQDLPGKRGKQLGDGYAEKSRARGVTENLSQVESVDDFRTRGVPENRSSPRNESSGKSRRRDV